MAGEHDEFGDDGEHENDNGYEEAMKRLAVLKSMPVESLTDAQRKEKLRLANRESARKMRRKQAEQLLAAEVAVAKLEQEAADYMAKLGEGWNRYKEIKAENEMLRNELQALQALQATVPDGEEAADAGTSATTEAAAHADGLSEGAPGPSGDALQQLPGGSAQPAKSSPEAVQPPTSGAPQGTAAGCLASLSGSGGQLAPS